MHIEFYAVSIFFLTKGETFMEKQTPLAMSPEKLFAIKLMLLCISLTFATTIYFIGVINFACLLLIYFGVLWNFFAKINSFLGLFLCLGTCVIFGFESISVGLYSHAILYLVFYVALELFVLILDLKGNTIFMRYKNLSLRESYFIVLSIFLFFMCGFAVSLYQNNMIFPAIDAVCSSMLALSAYLHSRHYREYYVIRPISLVLTVAMFAHIISIGFSNSAVISMLFLYVTYLALDIVEHVFLFSSKYRVKHSIRSISSGESVLTVDFEEKESVEEPKNERKKRGKDISA